MNDSKTTSMEPDQKIKLTEPELSEIVKVIALRIEELKDRYQHFNGYDSDKAIYRHDVIWYKHNVQYITNPKYSIELEARTQIPPIKRPEPERQIASYPEKDGIEIYIEFTEYEIYKSSQRMWVPDHWLGNYAVELKVKGADTQDLKDIREKIKEFILSVKRNLEFSHNNDFLG